MKPPVPPLSMLQSIPSFNEMRGAESLYTPPGVDSSTSNDEYSVMVDGDDTVCPWLLWVENPSYHQVARRPTKELLLFDLRCVGA